MLSDRGQAALLRELKGIEFDCFYCHDEPIPDSFNHAVARALAEDWWRHALFIEEDVVLPRGAIDSLLSVDSDIAAIDYRLKGYQQDRLSHLEAAGRILWVSLGCTLVDRLVFEVLPEPWFDVDHAIEGHHEGSTSEWRFELIKRPSIYGDQDVYFSFKAFEAGFSIGIVRMMLAEHLDLDYAVALDRGPQEQISESVILGRSAGR